MDILQFLAVLGGSLGIALGVSRLRPYMAALAAVAYALALIPMVMATTVPGDAPIGMRLMQVIDRFIYSTFALGRREFSNDWLFLLTWLGFFIWWISVQAGYACFRRGDLLAAILPPALMGLVAQVLDTRHAGHTWLLTAVFFLALLLFARRYTLQKKVEWKKHRVFLLPEANQDWLRGIIIVSLVIVLSAWGIPANLRKSSGAAEAWGTVTDNWDEFSDRFRREPSSEASGDSQSADSYGTQMPLGTSIFQGGKVIFTVIPTTVEGRHPRYYWRARVYDHYERGRWITTPADLLRIPARQDLPGTDARDAQSFLFTLSSDQTLFFHPGEPIRVDRPAGLLANRLPDGRLDVLALQTREVLPVGAIYEVRAVTSDPTIQMLLAAGEEYPAWVEQRYLQLPDDFSPRLRSLAADLSRQAETPYEKARAITAYLRETIAYSANIPEPPEGRDPLEWVLFDYRQGFCNYYASLAVLMLRSQGVPARLAVGYAQGDFDFVNQRYTVVRSDAHAWPEVYFTGIGWVEFEPTASQDELLRPVRAEADPPAGGTGTPSAAIEPPITNDRPDREEGAGEDPPAKPFRLPSWAFWLAGLLAAASLLWLGRRMGWGQFLILTVTEGFERQQLAVPGWLAYRAYLARAAPVERHFEAVNLALRWLEPAPIAGRTPAERARALKELLPQAATPIDLLTGELERAVYSPHAGDEAAARRAGRNITTSALRAGLVKRLVKFMHRHTFYRARKK